MKLSNIKKEISPYHLMTQSKGLRVRTEASRPVSYELKAHLCKL